MLRSKRNCKQDLLEAVALPWSWLDKNTYKSILTETGYISLVTPGSFAASYTVPVSLPAARSPRHTTATFQKSNAFIVRQKPGDIILLLLKHEARYSAALPQSASTCCFLLALRAAEGAVGGPRGLVLPPVPLFKAAECRLGCGDAWNPMLKKFKNNDKQSHSSLWLISI